MASLIEARQVLFSYRRSAVSSIAILQDFNMTIEAGECFCLLGPSGCGKTTALRLVAGFHYPDSGSVTVDGREIVAPGADRSVIFQGDDSLFHWLNAVDNVAFGLKMRGATKAERLATARRFLDVVGLHGQEGKYPAELSGGMKQRIQIARVLANDPKILLMDEPFGALDAQTRSELQDEFVRIWYGTGKTVLFITHDISEAILLGDRVGVMRCGPASNIREVFSVTLPRPRSRSSLEFGRLYESINDVIREEVRRSREAAHAESQ